MHPFAKDHFPVIKLDPLAGEIFLVLSMGPKFRPSQCQSIILTPETELFNDFAWVAIPPYRPFKDLPLRAFASKTSPVFLLVFTMLVVARSHGKLCFACNFHLLAGEVMIFVVDGALTVKLHDMFLPLRKVFF